MICLSRKLYCWALQGHNFSCFIYTNVNKNASVKFRMSYFLISMIIFCAFGNAEMKNFIQLKNGMPLKTVSEPVYQGSPDYRKSPLQYQSISFEHTLYRARYAQSFYRQSFPCGFSTP